MVTLSTAMLASVTSEVFLREINANAPSLTPNLIAVKGKRDTNRGPQRAWLMKIKDRLAIPRQRGWLKKGARLNKGVLAPPRGALFHILQGCIPGPELGESLGGKKAWELLLKRHS